MLFVFLNLIERLRITIRELYRSDGSYVYQYGMKLHFSLILVTFELQNQCSKNLTEYRFESFFLLQIQVKMQKLITFIVIVILIWAQSRSEILGKHTFFWMSWFFGFLTFEFRAKQNTNYNSTPHTLQTSDWHFKYKHHFVYVYMYLTATCMGYLVFLVDLKRVDGVVKLALEPQ